MKNWKLLLGHRLWGFSIGVLVGFLPVDKPTWVSIVIMIPFMYFMVFGDSHFKEKQ